MDLGAPWACGRLPTGGIMGKQQLAYGEMSCAQNPATAETEKNFLKICRLM